jgi:hypothetical protein
VIALFLSCSDNATDPKNAFKVSGYVYYNQTAVHNALVKVDENSELYSFTDKSGFFEIDEVTPGPHQLTIHKDLSDSSFSTRSVSIDVQDNISLDRLILPRGVQIFQPENITSNFVQLKWTSTDATDFREYKLYQHETSGLDESTGTLVHVSTDISDTSSTIGDLNPFKTYFFRVYVMNEYGKLGGSNIVSCTTENINLINNGSFEIINTYTNFADGWNIGSVIQNTYVEIDQTKSYEGNNSLHFWGHKGDYAFSTVETNLDPDQYLPDSKYELSMWVKHDSLASYHQGWIDIYPSNIRMYSINGPKSMSDWRQHTVIFNTPSTMEGTYYGFQFHFSQIMNQIVPELPLNIWIDNIEIKKTN